MCFHEAYSKVKAIETAKRMRTCVCSGVRAAIFCSIFHQTGANISRRGLEKRRTIFQFTLRVWKSSWSLSHWLICTFLWVNVERLRTTCFCPDGMPPETSYNRPQCQCNLMVTLWWADLLSFLQKNIYSFDLSSLCWCSISPASVCRNIVKSCWSAIFSEQ